MLKLMNIMAVIDDFVENQVIFFFPFLLGLFFSYFFTLARCQRQSKRKETRKGRKNIPFYFYFYFYFYFICLVNPLFFSLRKLFFNTKLSFQKGFWEKKTKDNKNLCLLRV